MINVANAKGLVPFHHPSQPARRRYICDFETAFGIKCSGLLQICHWYSNWSSIGYGGELPLALLPKPFVTSNYGNNNPGTYWYQTRELKCSSVKSSLAHASH